MLGSKLIRRSSVKMMEQTALARAGTSAAQAEMDMTTVSSTHVVSMQSQADPGSRDDNRGASETLYEVANPGQDEFGLH